MRDEKVRLLDKSLLHIQVIPPEAFVVLEDALHLVVAEELTEEAKLADRHVGEARSAVGVDVFIDDVVLVALREHAADFALVIGAGVEPAFRRSLGKLRIRAGVGQGIGKGVACIVG